MHISTPVVVEKKKVPLLKCSFLLLENLAVSCLWESKIHDFVHQLIHCHEVVTNTLLLQLLKVLLKHLHRYKRSQFPYKKMVKVIEHISISTCSAKNLRYAYLMVLQASDVLHITMPDI